MLTFLVCLGLGRERERGEAQNSLSLPSTNDCGVCDSKPDQFFRPRSVLSRSQRVPGRQTVVSGELNPCRVSPLPGFGSRRVVGGRWGAGNAGLSRPLSEKGAPPARVCRGGWGWACGGSLSRPPAPRDGWLGGGREVVLQTQQSWRPWPGPIFGPGDLVTHPSKSPKEPAFKERLPEVDSPKCVVHCVRACARVCARREGLGVPRTLSGILYFAILCSQNRRRACSALRSEPEGAVASSLARAELAAGLQTVSPCSPGLN